LIDYNLQVLNIANDTNFLCNGIEGARVKNRSISTSLNAPSIYSGSIREKQCSSAYIAEARKNSLSVHLREL